MKKRIVKKIIKRSRHEYASRQISLAVNFAKRKFETATFTFSIPVRCMTGYPLQWWACPHDKTWRMLRQITKTEVLCVTF